MADHDLKEIDESFNKDNVDDLKGHNIEINNDSFSNPKENRVEGGEGQNKDQAQIPQENQNVNEENKEKDTSENEDKDIVSLNK